jgi:hypothetical protein
MKRPATPPKTLRSKIARLRLWNDGPCAPARRWANGKDPRAAWRECKRGEWLAWLVLALQEQAGVGEDGRAHDRVRDARDHIQHTWEKHNPHPGCICAKEGEKACDLAAERWERERDAPMAIEIRKRFRWPWVERRARKLNLL